MSRPIKPAFGLQPTRATIWAGVAADDWVAAVFFIRASDCGGSCDANCVAAAAIAAVSGRVEQVVERGARRLDDPRRFDNPFTNAWRYRNNPRTHAHTTCTHARTHVSKQLNSEKNVDGPRLGVQPPAGDSSVPPPTTTTTRYSTRMHSGCLGKGMLCLPFSHVERSLRSTMRLSPVIFVPVGSSGCM